MLVSKWGNSLAARLPKTLVEELDLKPGDSVELTPTEPRRLAVGKADPRAEFLDRLQSFNWPLPSDYKFDREEANSR